MGVQAFVVAGDVCDWSNDDDCCDSIATYVTPHLDGTPLYSCVGNHESDAVYDATDVWANARLCFGDMRLGKEWYSVDIGNVRFIFLNTLSNADGDSMWCNRDTSAVASDNTPPYREFAVDGSDQWDFCEAELLRGGVDFRFIVSHYGLYGVESISGLRNWGQYRSGGSTWGDMIEDSGCDILMTGDEHHYVRLLPIKDNDDDATATQATGYTMHLKVGMCGRRGAERVTCSDPEAGCLDSLYTPDGWVAFRDSSQTMPRLMILETAGAYLSATVYGLRDSITTQPEVLDTFTIDKR
jgi:hypothetical protein